MKKSIHLILFYIALLMPTLVFAASPVLTFTPLTATTIQVPVYGTATVQYTVENQSSKAHALVMEAITGVTQTVGAGRCSNPFTLGAKQACTLSLQITGNQLAGNFQGGPVVCQQGSNGQPNPLFCYQPSVADILNITLDSTIFYSGTQNGNVYYSINNGSTWTATAVAAGGCAIDSVFAANTILYAASENGFIYYSTNNGNSWLSTTQPDGSAVKAVFATGNTLYASTANGFVYYSTNGGNTWTNTANAPDGSSVNGIFIIENTIYAGTANGNVYYSTNNGTTWTAINGQPDGSAIKNIFVMNATLYVNTANEYAYSSTSLTGGGTWTTIAQTVYSLFARSSNNSLYAGTQNGYVFSLTTGTALGFVTSSPINSVYVLN